LNHRRVAAVAATTVLALLAGCTSGSDQSSTSTSTAASSGNAGGTVTSGSSAAPGSSGAAAGIAWTSCGDGFECATVPVPLDWSAPDGEQINLAVIKHPATKPDQRIGTMFLDPGGPGVSGSDFVRDGSDDIDKWGDGRFDLIGWDLRGTHASSPVKCFASDADAAAFWEGVAIPSTSEEAAAYINRMKDVAQRCAETMGPLLSNISTTDTVRDMDRIREFVGDETITYSGLSYGTFIGQIYANMFPDRVRAMMLDGIVSAPDYVASAETRTSADAATTDQVFTQFLTLCDQAGPDKCALAGHGEPAAARVTRLFEQVKQAPIPAPTMNPPDQLRYSDLKISSFSPMRDPHSWPQYAADLNAAVDGDVTALVTAVQSSRAPAYYDEAMKSAAISCLDGPASQTVDDWPTVIGNLDASSVMSGSVQGWWLWAPCAANSSAKRDDRYTGPWDAKTKEPILLIGTRYDPNTGYRNTVRTQLLLGNAVLLTHQGYGHLSFNDFSTCIEKARTAYLVDLQVPAPGTVCASDEQPFNYTS
jgi:pimeloyl-ACP methyl ester carboxylesterase